MPNTINKAKTTKRKGVKNLPIISTIFDFERERASTNPKKITANTFFDKLGNKGSIPTSNVVAAVRGIATKGPIHRITSKVRILISSGCVFCPKSVKFVPAFATISTPRKGVIIAVIKKPANAVSHSLPVSKPIKGGRIRFPAPKNIANRANPTVIIVFSFDFISFYRKKLIIN